MKWRASLVVSLPGHPVCDFPSHRLFNPTPSEAGLAWDYWLAPSGGFLKLRALGVELY